jgi:general secretion pathway protein F/type IV pilus assembly protein PilC
VPEFTFEAMSGSGQRSQGSLTANSEREVMAMLDSRGLFPMRITQQKQTTQHHLWAPRIRGRYMAAFYSQLADLLKSGVPLLRSLEILERQSSQVALIEILREVRARVADGTGLAEAMAPHTRAFNELAVSMVRAGQEGGFLEDVLRRIADFTEHQEDLKAKVAGALAYPIFLMVMGSTIITILMVFFVPKFNDIFERLREKNQLPFLTRALMGTSGFMQNNWWWMLAVGIGVFFGYRTWARSESGRMLVDAWKLRLPLVGKIFLHLAIARFSRILGTLLHNGIPILAALRIAKDSTGNRVLTLAIELSAENIKSGDSLATPLAACKHFPRDVVEMVAVGEESNSLEKVLLDIAEGLEKRTARQLELFVRLLEPLMLLVMAGIVLMVVAGLLLPVFKMSTAIGD